MGLVPALYQLMCLSSQHWGGSLLTFQVGGQSRLKTFSLLVTICITFILCYILNNNLEEYVRLYAYTILFYFISLVLAIEHRAPCKLSTFNTTELCHSSLCCFYKKGLEHSKIMVPWGRSLELTLVTEG